MDVLEVSVWITANGLHWEGVGYYSLPQDPVAAVCQANLIAQAVADGCAVLPDVDWSTFEVFAAPYRVCEGDSIRNVARWLGDHEDKGNYGLLWTSHRDNRKGGKTHGW